VTLLKKESTKKGRPQTFKLCESCGVEFGPIPRLSTKYCSRECKHDKQRTGRLIIRKTIPIARRAQRRVAYMIEKGELVRPKTCEECGRDNKKIEAAHKDYSKPLDVRWLCKSCHVKWDRLEPKNATYIIKRWQDFTDKEAVLESTGEKYNQLLESRS